MLWSRQGTGAVLMGALLQAAVLTGVWGQTPDNRDIQIDPADPGMPLEYRETLEERDRQRLEEAVEEGESFMPFATGEGEEREPLVEEAPPPAPVEVPVAAYEHYEDAAPAREVRPEVADLLGVLLEAWSREPEIVRVGYPALESEGGGESAPAAPVAPSVLAAALERIGAGQGLYGRVLYTVDSDLGGPVLIEILERPVAGAVASGGFTLVGERLVLRLGRLEWRGESRAIDGWGVDLDCACYGVSGEVDSHFLARVVLPAAVGFAEGFLTAVGRASESVTLIGGEVEYRRGDSSLTEDIFSGLAAGVREAGDVLLEGAPGGPTVRLPRDTELVVLFASGPVGELTVVPAGEPVVGVVNGDG